VASAAPATSVTEIQLSVRMQGGFGERSTRCIGFVMAARARAAVVPGRW
jgi:hypothetical protein